MVVFSMVVHVVPLSPPKKRGRGTLMLLSRIFYLRIERNVFIKNVLFI